MKQPKVLALCYLKMVRFASEKTTIAVNRKDDRSQLQPRMRSKNKAACLYICLEVLTFK